ncbi:DUF4197 domain-containing protein [Methylibium rhizosphaerae]|jgi:hypothetical protein|uniref:DUF4197 domain-containing protein n=1 Tax=Methylibium rhizosphaerae TaxID=2570323 RepID=UPI001129FEAA|nr:DUF4197 domain-containing protein [Methylibium rhizosphaerae]
MKRRDFAGGVGVLGLGGWSFAAHALSLSDADAVSGLRAALERGAGSAVNLLGRTDGFLGNPQVRIPLPEWLEKSAGLLRAAGQGHRVDELETAMNRAAEAAVPEAKALLVNAVRKMSVSDAKGILTGGDTSVTQFFADKTREPLGVRFLPIVTRATEKVSLASKYNRVAGKAALFGLVKAEHANIEQYVTGKALDGLYLMIGEEERKIRQDPVGTGSAILRRVFGALK